MNSWAPRSRVRRSDPALSVLSLRSSVPVDRVGRRGLVIVDISTGEHRIAGHVDQPDPQRGGVHSDMRGAIGHSSPVVPSRRGVHHHLGSDPLNEVTDRRTISYIHLLTDHLRRGCRPEAGTDDRPTGSCCARGHSRTEMAGDAGNQDSI